MNTRNDWQYILQLANEDLGLIRYSILITEPEEGFYNCEIWKDGEMVELYAENYYENELNDLVTEVWHYINNILEEE
jgi:hypothetical protein